MVKWFHGGVPGLDVGDMLVSPSEHGKQATFSQYRHLPGAEVMRQDRVYAVRDKVAAAMYAGMYPHGDVYEVELLGEQRDDPDCTVPGYSVECERARIVGVVRRRVRPEESAALMGVA